MDIQRTLLIIGLAVVSYLMILQWQEDYGQAATINAAQNNSQSYPQVSSQPSTGAAVIPNAPALSQDVPMAQEEIVKPAVGEVASPISTQLISIETDVLTVEIDPVGGDIVSVSLSDYPVSIEQPDVPFQLLNRTAEHTYIAQSGLVGIKGTDKAGKPRPLYQSDSQVYSLGSDDKLVVDLRLTQDDGVKITKRLTFTKGEYLINVDVIVDNVSNETWSAALFAQIKRDGSVDPGLDTSGFGLPIFLGGAYWDEDQAYNKKSLDEFSEEPLNKKIAGGWLAFIQHYFMSAWVPDQSMTLQYQTRTAAGNHIISYVTPAVQVNAGDRYTFTNRFYAGPKILKTLEEIEPEKGLDLVVDYGPLFFLSKPLYLLLNFYHSLVANWGLAIILLTVTVKAIFFPLSAASYRSMANMRRVTPKLTEIRERHADDRQKLSQEMMKLYKDEKINPLGGCLPVLIQMPVFLALYWALLESVELRQAPFFGWIHDLSVMDPYFVLPIIMAASMFFQQMLNPVAASMFFQQMWNPAPPDPMQAKMMKMMPLIFGVFFLFFPSGLVLYWVTNNLLSIAQQWHITRGIEKKAAENP